MFGADRLSNEARGYFGPDNDELVGTATVSVVRPARSSIEARDIDRPNEVDKVAGMPSKAVFLHVSPSRIGGGTYPLYQPLQQPPRRARGARARAFYC